MSDWKGNNKSAFSTLGASNHSETERQSEDYYATEPKAVRMLLELESFRGTIWECACGEGHLSKEMIRLGYNVYSSDLIDRGYGQVEDFLSIENQKTTHNIITNPPYRYASEFIKKSFQIMERGTKLALFLPIRYLEGKERKQLFRTYPPKIVYVSSSRIKCAKNGEFEEMNGSAMSFAWYVWEIGSKTQTVLGWFN